MRAETVKVTGLSSRARGRADAWFERFFDGQTPETDSLRSAQRITGCAPGQFFRLFLGCDSTANQRLHVGLLSLELFPLTLFAHDGYLDRFPGNDRDLP